MKHEPINLYLVNALERAYMPGYEDNDSLTWSIRSALHRMRDGNTATVIWGAIEGNEDV